jgi:hypothetical protein
MIGKMNAEHLMGLLESFKSAALQHEVLDGAGFEELWKKHRVELFDDAPKVRLYVPYVYVWGRKTA